MPVDFYKKAMQLIAECNQACRGDGSHFGQPWKAAHLIAELIGVERRSVIWHRLHAHMRREAWECSLGLARKVSSK